MDTKTLVVGQEVWLKTGPYTRKGKVVDISFLKDYVQGNGARLKLPVGVAGVEPVEPLYTENELRCLILFDANGKTGDAWNGLDSWEYIGDEIGWLQSDPRTPGTAYGHWELGDTSSV